MRSRRTSERPPFRFFPRFPSTISFRSREKKERKDEIRACSADLSFSFAKEKDPAEGGEGEGRGEERRERERELVNKVNEKSVDERMMEVEDSLARNESAQVQWDEKERIFTREFEWIVRQADGVFDCSSIEKRRRNFVPGWLEFALCAAKLLAP